MLQDFRRLPEPLQKQILIRLGLGAAFAVLLAVLLSVTGDVFLWLPCAGIVIFHAVSAFLLFRTAILCDYVVVSGECAGTGLTSVRRRTKSIVLKTDAGAVRVVLRNRLRKIVPGTPLNLYISKKSQVYEQNGEQILYNYIALDVK